MGHRLEPGRVHRAKHRTPVDELRQIRDLHPEVGAHRGERPIDQARFALDSPGDGDLYLLHPSVLRAFAASLPRPAEQPVTGQG